MPKSGRRGGGSAASCRCTSSARLTTTLFTGGCANYSFHPLLPPPKSILRSSHATRPGAGDALPAAAAISKQRNRIESGKCRGGERTILFFKRHFAAACWSQPRGGGRRCKNHLQQGAVLSGRCSSSACPISPLLDHWLVSCGRTWGCITSLQTAILTGGHRRRRKNTQNVNLWLEILSLK